MYSNDNIHSAFARLQERVALTDEAIENRNAQMDNLFYSQKQSIAALQSMSECVNRISIAIDNSIESSRSSKQVMAVKIQDLNTAFAHLVKQHQVVSPLQLLIIKISAVVAFIREYLRHINARGIICGVVVCNAAYIVWKNLPPKQWE